MDLDKARREEVRWLVLRALYSAQEIGTSEAILRNTVESVVPYVTEMEIRRAMDYLAERELITIDSRNKPVWFGKINRHGIDVVEGTVECHPGIARPRDW